MSPADLARAERAEAEVDLERTRRRIAHLQTWMASGRLAPAAYALAEMQLAEATLELHMMETSLQSEALIPRQIGERRGR